MKSESNQLAIAWQVLKKTVLSVSDPVQRMIGCVGATSKGASLSPTALSNRFRSYGATLLFRVTSYKDLTPTEPIFFSWSATLESTRPWLFAFHFSLFTGHIFASFVSLWLN